MGIKKAKSLRKEHINKWDGIWFSFYGTYVKTVLLYVSRVRTSSCTKEGSLWSTEFCNLLLVEQCSNLTSELVYLQNLGCKGREIPCEERKSCKKINGWDWDELALGIISLKETAHRRKLSCSYMLVIKLLIHKKAITL